MCITDTISQRVNDNHLFERQRRLISDFRCYVFNELVVSVLSLTFQIYSDDRLGYARSMSHDESRFPSPHEFVPERFLNDDGSLKPNDIEHIAFGFGRRGCPGRYFADPSVWGVMAKVLAVFKVLKPLDENGMEVPVEPKFKNAAVV